MTWRELESTTNRWARLLRSVGVRPGSMVAVALPNSPEHVMATIAAWKVGGCVLPLRFDLPAGERERVLAVAKPRAIIGNWPEATARTSDLEAAHTLPDDPLPPQVPDPSRAIASSGSTGRPKLVVGRGGGEAVPGESFGPFADTIGGTGMVHLIIGPLYHVNAFSTTHSGLFEDQRIVLTESFDSGLVLGLIERHKVNTGTFVPTVLLRLLQHPTVRERDYSSITSILVGGSACPEWVLREWIDILGGERIVFGYGASESIGCSLVRGDEWLEHPGTVGRGTSTDVRVLRENGTDCTTGEIGLVYMRPEGATDVLFTYIGAEPPRATDDAFVTLGDLGWLDEDGYLYIADRRVDMIVTGGANVFPAEVESVLSEHPAVLDAAVVGVADPDWGRRVHAVLVPTDAAHPPDADELDAFCRERLAAYKLPKSYEFVAEIPHTESGKIQHHVLADERTDGVRPEWMVPRAKAGVER